MLKKGFFYLTASIFMIGALNATDTNTTLIKSESEKVVISINDNNYTSSDFPLEFKNLKSSHKSSFLVIYSNYKLMLDSLKKEQNNLQKEIDSLINKRYTNTKRLGIKIDKLKDLISTLKLKLDTIAYKKVEANHPKMQEEVKTFFNEHKKDYNYPNYVEVSSIRVKDENLSKKIINKINLENNTSKLTVFIEESQKYRLRADKNFTYMGAIVAENKKYGKDFFDKLWKAQEGNILTEPIKKGNIYYILYIHKKVNAGNSSFDFVKDDIKKYLLIKERVQWIKDRYKDIKKDSKVIIYNNNL